jgi:hypothetical protein
VAAFPFAFALPEPRLGTTSGSLHAAPPMLDLLATSIDPSIPPPDEELALGETAARLASVEPLAGLSRPQPSAAAILDPIVMLALGAQ